MSGRNPLLVVFGRQETANGKEVFADRRGYGTGNT
jgi:hypothetical protein